MCSGGAETHREVHVGITFSFFLSFQLSTMTTPTWILHILKCPHKNSYLGSSLTDVCFQACIFKTTEIKCFKYLHFNWNIIFLWPPSLYLSQSREKKKKNSSKTFQCISWRYILRFYTSLLSGGPSLSFNPPLFTKTLKEGQLAHCTTLQAASASTHHCHLLCFLSDFFFFNLRSYCRFR